MKQGQEGVKRLIGRKVAQHKEMRGQGHRREMGAGICVVLGLNSVATGAVTPRVGSRALDTVQRTVLR